MIFKSKIKKLLILLLLTFVGIFSTFTLLNPLQLENKGSTNNGNSDKIDLNNTVANEGDLKIFFYPLGNKMEGDSCIITYNDIQILIDAGSYASSASTIINRITDLGMKDNVWDYVIATHADTDHIAAFSTNDILSNDAGVFAYFIKNNIKIGTLIDFDFNNDETVQFEKGNKSSYFDSNTYRLYKNRRDSMIRDNQIEKYFTASQCCWEERETNNFIDENGLKNQGYLDAKNNGATSRFELAPNLTLNILYNYFYDHRIADSTAEIGSGDKNIISTCVLLQYNTQKFLFTGDLEEYDSSKKVNTNPVGYKRIYGETELIKYNSEILKDVTLYKAGHHGKKTSSCTEFIDHIKPEFVPITCIANTSTHTSSKNSDRTPSQIVLDNLTKYTDNIFPISKAIMDSENNMINCEDFYGKITFTSDGNDTSVATTGEHLTESTDEFAEPKTLFNTEWFNTYRTSKIHVYNLSTYINPSTAYFGQCTLVKYGSYDIVIDCGTQYSGDGDMQPNYSDIFIKKLKKYIVDDTIDCLIVTTQCPASYQQVIDVRDHGIQFKGLFHHFKIKNLIDYGIAPDPTEYATMSQYKSYLELRKSLPKKGTNYYDGTHYIEKEQTMNLNLPVNLYIDILNNIHYHEKNSHSLCFTINFKNHKMLFTGRIHEKAEEDLIKHNTLTGVVYYLLPDFGNNTSASELMLKTLKGSNNDYFAIANTVPGKDFHGNLNMSREIMKRLLDLCPHPYMTIDCSKSKFKNLANVTDLTNDDTDFHFYIAEYFRNKDDITKGSDFYYTLENIKRINVIQKTSWYKEATK